MFEVYILVTRLVVYLDKRRVRFGVKVVLVGFHKICVDFGFGFF